MSSNVSALDQAQAVDPAPAPDFPHPSSQLSVFLPNDDGGPHDGVQQAPNIYGPIPIPSSLTDKQKRQNVAKMIGEEGLDAAAHLAVRYHQTTNRANPPTHEELMERMDHAKNGLGEKWELFHQDHPNSMAARLLAPRAGQRYGFEEFKSTWTNAKGKEFYGQKCEAPNCEYRNKDGPRHMDDQHVKDPVFALYCPYGCGRVHYRGRDCEMARDFKSHKEKDGALPTFESA